MKVATVLPEKQAS